MSTMQRVGVCVLCSVLLPAPMVVAQTAEAALPGGVPPWHLSFVGGQAFIDREGQSEPAEAGMALLDGDRLRTEEGRLDAVLSDGLWFHLHGFTTVDLVSDGLVRFVRGGVVVTVRDPDRAYPFQMDASLASIQSGGSSEFGVTSTAGDGGTELVVAVFQGSAFVANDLGAEEVSAGETAVVREGLAPSRQEGFDSTRWDGTDPSGAQRGDDADSTASADALPPEPGIDPGAFDQDDTSRDDQNDSQVVYLSVVSAVPGHGRGPGRPGAGAHGDSARRPPASWPSAIAVAERLSGWIPARSRTPAGHGAPRLGRQLLRLRRVPLRLAATDRSRERRLAGTRTRAAMATLSTTRRAPRTGASMVAVSTTRRAPRTAAAMVAVSTTRRARRLPAATGCPRHRPCARTPTRAAPAASPFVRRAATRPSRTHRRTRHPRMAVPARASRAGASRRVVSPPTSRSPIRRPGRRLRATIRDQADRAPRQAASRRPGPVAGAAALLIDGEAKDVLPRLARPPGHDRRALRACGDAGDPGGRAPRVHRRPAARVRARRVPPEHDYARLRAGRPGHRRVRHAAPRHPQVRGDPAAHAAGDPGRRGRGVRAPHRHPAGAAVRHGGAEPRVPAPPDGRRGQHADAAARAQALPEAREDPRTEGQGVGARAPDREAVHQARDLHALLQPDEPRPRRVRGRGGRARVLRQAGQGPDARRGRDHCRHPAAARAPEPVHQPEMGHAAPQLHARADGRRGFHHGGSGRCRAEEADRPRRAAGVGELEGAVLRGGGPPAPRAALRRAGTLRGRLDGPNDARRRPAGGRDPRTGSRLESARQAPGLPQRRPQRHRRGPRGREPPRTAVGSPDCGRRHRAGGGDGGGARCGEGQGPGGGRRDEAAGAGHGARPRGEVRGRPRTPGVPVDGPAVGRGPREGGRSHRRRGLRHRRSRRHHAGVARADPARGGRLARDRQPDRADPGDGRRVRLRAEQVQPGGAGAAPDRVGLQAHRVHGGHRSRLHALIAHRRRAGVLQRRAGPAPVSAPELRPQVRGHDHAPPRDRRLAQRAHRQADGAADASRR